MNTLEMSCSNGLFITDVMGDKVLCAKWFSSVKIRLHIVIIPGQSIGLMVSVPLKLITLYSQKVDEGIKCAALCFRSPTNCSVVNI